MRLVSFAILVTLFGFCGPFETPLVEAQGGGKGIPSDIELPPDIKVNPPAPDSPYAFFSGVWLGRWAGNKLNHVLVVESASEDTCRVIYAIGKYPPWRARTHFQRAACQVQQDTLSVKLQSGARVEYQFDRSTDTLKARYVGGPWGTPVWATMKRVQP